MPKPKILFIANNNLGYGLSGGDTIFIQLLKHWQRHCHLTLLASQEAINIINPRPPNLRIIKTDIINPNARNTLGNLFVHYLRRLSRAYFTIQKHYQFLTDHNIVYSVSDFLPDLLPSLYLKIKSPRLKWVAGYYLFAPAPWTRKSPYHGLLRTKGLVYWLIQQITLPLVNRYADFILVTSSPDIRRFRHQHRVIVIRGGVDIDAIQKYVRLHPPVSPAQRKYSACFLGRFHPQKGLLELIDIWKIVVSHHPNAKLVLIGKGELETQIRHKITQLHLDHHIKILGFRRGNPKYSILQKSKIIVHPATYDSGGMAAAEGLAFGLPGVSFDLEALKTYYPQGMLKTPCFNLELFAHNILDLLTDTRLYQKTSQEALNLISAQWDWKERSAKIFRKISKLS